MNFFNIRFSKFVNLTIINAIESWFKRKKLISITAIEWFLGVIIILFA
jgi:hypothetical protein